jgi:hypothetical protein
MGGPDRVGCVLAHLSTADSAVLVSILQLATFAMTSRERWRKFVFFIVLLLVARAGWWALADSGVHNHHGPLAWLLESGGAPAPSGRGGVMVTGGSVRPTGQIPASALLKRWMARTVLVHRVTGLL